MIRKQDILDRAAEWQLRADVVEKDYVLGWLLVSLASLPELRSLWVFKGGTCIKKCYFETYRFSEDLDFSLLPDAPYDEQAILANLQALTRVAGELSAIDFPEALVEVRLQRNKLGKPTYQGRISYRGPLLFPGPPRVLFDITQQEPVLDAPAAQAVFHPYPDGLPNDQTVLTYSLDELLAEKTRALYERTRPRDLYDVIYLLENRAEAFHFPHVRELFHHKCRVKSVEPPSAAQILKVVQNDDELQSEWENMLGHQLPVLPKLDDLVARLPGLLGWVDEPIAVIPEVALPAVPIEAGHVPVAPAGIQYWGAGSPLEKIRFAGATRLLLEFSYHGRPRVVEPYSLRRASTGNVLLYAWELTAGHIKAFKVVEMLGVHATAASFQPRYRVEFTPHGPVDISSAAMSVPRAHAPKRSSSGRARSGPTYVFECTYCGKKFRHTKNDPELRKHKQKDGYWDCPGRRGYLVDTQWP
ncbi:MAG: nucleotidyl transferase AbiEii/AbiGii toxin family protein [Acidobacteria bacterium]|nr:nucleotidyl transferase AbiEii/AbiGii toxin family protein [Acidobacteriota bacterium]